MKEPVHFCEEPLPILRNIIEDLEKRFEKTPFDKVVYTIRLKKLEKETGISTTIAALIVKNFLKVKKKRYEHMSAPRSGSKYIINVNRKEFKEWKEYVENIEKRRL